MHKLIVIWIAQGCAHLPKFKISAFWNDLKGVKNPHDFYLINARVVEGPGFKSRLGDHFLVLSDLYCRLVSCVQLCGVINLVCKMPDNIQRMLYNAIYAIYIGLWRILDVPGLGSKIVIP